MEKISVNGRIEERNILRAICHLKYGGYGDCVEVENSKRKIVRASQPYTAHPYCYLYDNGKFIREEISFEKAISFLFDIKIDRNKNQEIFEFIYGS